MKSFRSPLALLLLVLLPLGLGGCLFDNPLTGWSSTNIDTRLLGVFEFKEADPNAPKNPPPPDPTKPVVDTSIIHRVAVLPLDANRYVIYYRDFSKKPKQVWKFTGWISRVDARYYLTVRDDTEGSKTFGKYGFFRFDWEFPGNFLLYAPEMKDVDATASSYHLRTAVRKKLKEGTLFPFEATWWRKIARVWWDPTGAEAGASIPPEFEKGTTEENPGF
ncbi:MAG: hypothetical protein ACREKL_12975 [Chthoniobacterales bacterium]